MKKNIKLFSLIMNVIAIVITSAILIGSTFAWFTDSASSTGNKIQSGTLKVDLELLDVEDGWTSLKESNEAIFDYDKWEPGFVDVKILKVENEGTLALQWKAQFVSQTQLSILANVIDVYVLPSQTEIGYPADRDLTGYTRVGTVAEFVNTIETTTYGVLLANESAYLGIALKMRTEDVGNEYQGLDIGGTFDIRIVATQLSYESDSFDNGYDNDAWVDGMKVYSANDLQSAISAGNNVVLMKNITLTEPIVIPAPATTTYSLRSSAQVLDLNGKNLTAETTNAINNQGAIVLTNGTITAKSAYAIVNQGDLVIENATINNGINGYGNSSITVTNSIVNTTRGNYSHAIRHVGTGALTIYSGTFTGNGNEVIQTESSEAYIYGGTFQKVEKTSYLIGGNKLTIYGGTFLAHESNPAAHPVTLPAPENVESVSGDATLNPIVAPYSARSGVPDGTTPIDSAYSVPDSTATPPVVVLAA